MDEPIAGLINIASHRLLLTDKFRMAFFKKTIAANIKAGHKVVELGAGTGILSFLAAECGAIVTAVEYDRNNFENLRKNISNNGLSEKVRPIHADAKYYVANEAQDFIICEMCHCGFLVERQINIINSFLISHREKFGAIPEVIPSRAVMEFDLICCEYMFYDYNIKTVHYEDPYSEDESFIAPVSEKVVYAAIDYRAKLPDETIRKRGSFKTIREGSINTLRLSMFISQSEALNSSGDRWFLSNIHFPLTDSFNAGCGETIEYEIEYKAGSPLQNFNFTMKRGENIFFATL